MADENKFAQRLATGYVQANDGIPQNMIPVNASTGGQPLSPALQQTYNDLTKGMSAVTVPQEAAKVMRDAETRAAAERAAVERVQPPAPHKTVTGDLTDILAKENIKGAVDTAVKSLGIETGRALLAGTRANPWLALGYAAGSTLYDHRHEIAQGVIDTSNARVADCKNGNCGDTD